MKSNAAPHAHAIAAVAALLVFLPGCSTSTYVVQVDAIAKPLKEGQVAAAPQSYHIQSKNPNLDESSLRYKEVADYVKTALSGKGMYEAPKPEMADVMINVDYGMDAPRVKFETISTPIFIQSPPQLVTHQVPQTIRMPDGTTRTVMVEVQEMIPGQREYYGEQTEIRPVIVYEKFLKLSARENREISEGRAPPEVWSVNVSAEDKSQELRKYLPILASATADYIGTNTKESKPVKINEKDEVVDFIKKGI